MQNSKKTSIPSRHGIHLSRDQCPKTPEEIEHMSRVPYAQAVGSLMYIMLCTRPDICYAVGMASRYQSNPGLEHWAAVKHIFKYLSGTKNYVLEFQAGNLVPLGFTDSDFQADRDSRKSTSGYVFTLCGSAISWKSVKQDCIADSTTEAEYIAANEAAKEAIWLRKFLIDLEVVPAALKPIALHCDNTGAVALCKEPRYHKKSKHIERKYHRIRSYINTEIVIERVDTAENMADPLTKTLTEKVFARHVESMGVKFYRSEH